jgi:hypothetical protein
MVPAKGYADEKLSVVEQINKLETYLVKFPAQIKKISAEELLQKPVSGKWSKQEIVGHLVDSAINNLKRFTEIQFSPQPARIIGYDQVNLISVNDYQHLPIDHLLELWTALNRQVVFVVRKIPSEKLDYAVDPQYESKEMKTLGWVICDYVAHMEHHFRQIFGEQDLK